MSTLFALIVHILARVLERRRLRVTHFIRVVPRALIATTIVHRTRVRVTRLSCPVQILDVHSREAQGRCVGVAAAAVDLSSLASMRIMMALRVSLRCLSLVLLVVMWSVGRVKRVCRWVGGGSLTRAFRAVVLTWSGG